MLPSALQALLLCLVVAAPLSAQQNQLPPHLAPAVQAFQAGRLDEATAQLDAIVSTDPEDGMAWYFLGLTHHSAGRLDQAARGHLLARAMLSQGHPLRVNATYNMACVYALKGNTERGLLWLHRARNQGFNNPGLLASDTDLDSLRDDPRFAAFVSGSATTPARAGHAVVDSPAGVLAGGTGGVTFAPDGGVFVADFGNRVYHVADDGSSRVHATGFGKAADCVVDGEGHLLQVDFGNSRVFRIAPDGTSVDMDVGGLAGPVGIDIADDGTIYCTNFNTQAICRIEAGQPAETVSQGGLLNGPNGLCVVGDTLYVCNFNDGTVLGIDRATGEQHFVTMLAGGGNGHVAWAADALWVTDRKGNRIVRVTPDGDVSVVAGTGASGTTDGDAASATFALPNGIAVSADAKTLWTNDAVGGSNQVRRVRVGEG